MYLSACPPAQVPYLTRLDKFIFITSLLMSLDIVLELVIAHLAVVIPDRCVMSEMIMHEAVIELHEKHAAST